MTLEIVITVEGLAASGGMTVRELYKLMRLPYPGDGPAPAQQTAGRKKYRYMQGDSISGICEICAPFVGVLTNGDGTDGVPRLPQHPNCVCWLSPIIGDVIVGGRPEQAMEYFEWIESLSRDKLARVIGPTRAAMYFAKLVEKISDFYNSDFMLIALSDLGFDRKGVPL
jgi:hypothetical protein